MARRYLVAVHLLCIILSSAAQSSRGALNGRALRCCVMHEPPLASLTNQTFVNNGLHGIAAQYVAELQAYLNWTCSSVTPYDDGTSTGFSAFIDMMQHCSQNGTVKAHPRCMCDIGVGGWFQTPSRFHQVDFLPPFTTDSYRVFADFSNTVIDLQPHFFLTSFSTNAWILIAVQIVTFAVLRLMDSRFAPAPSYHPLPNTQPFFTRFWYGLINHPLSYRIRRSIRITLSRMILSPDVDDIRNAAQWFIDLLQALCSLFLLMVYSASMTASLVQHSFSAKFRDAADFKSCRIKPSDVCTLKGGTFELFWRKVIAANERDCHRNDSPTFLRTYEEVFSHVSQKKCLYGLHLESTAKDAIHNRYCGRFTLIGDELYTGGLSMILPKHSPMTKHMTEATLALQDIADSPRMTKYFMNRRNCEANLATTVGAKKLELFFSLSFLLLGLIWIVLVFKLLRSFMKRRRMAADNDVV